MELNKKNTFFHRFIHSGQEWKVFFLCFAVMFGPAYSLMDTFDYNAAENPDFQTYLNLSAFDFHESPIRRYRVVVPMLVSAVHFILEPFLDLMTPWSFPGPDFSLGMSYLLVNNILMALFGVFVYKLVRHYNVSFVSALIGLLCMLTCRWTAYMIGIPSVDSLYLLVIAMSLYGIVSGNTKWMICAIFLGPWAKESFVFFVPLILIYAPIKLHKQAIYFTLSGVLVFSFRALFDYANGLETMGLDSNVQHFENVIPALKRLFSFHGGYELFSIIGVWVVLFFTLFHQKVRLYVKERTPAFSWLFLMIVFVHAILSKELARMFYIALPLIVLWVSLISEKIRILSIQER